MAWRKITEQDLVSALSRAEVEAFRRSADFDADPVEAQISDTVAFVRGAIRTGGKCRLCPDEQTLPASLARPAMNHLRYELLTRMNVVPNEARKSAWKMAQELFEELRDGKYVPESWNADEAEATSGPCAEVVKSCRSRVTPEKLEGL